MPPVLKYVVKNVAFVVSSFRGLRCSCTLPVLLPSFIRKPFANSGEGLHFSPLQFYRCQQWMRGLPDWVLTSANSIPEASSLALVPERGTWYGILYPCNAWILKLSWCFGLSKQRAHLPQNNTSTCFSVRELWSNSPLLWTVHLGSFQVFLNLSQSSKYFKAGQKAKDLVFCGWCVLLEDNYIFKVYDSAGLLFHFRIIIL